MKALRDPIWQFIGALVALGALFAAYDIFFRGKPQKEMQILLTSATSLVEIKPEAAQDIEILYKGQRAAFVSLVQIQILNSGNQPITENDYSRPISFSFEPKDEIADASIAGSVPENIGMVITKTSKYQAEAHPTLLNPGDSVTVRFVIVQDSSSTSYAPRIDGRIAGVKNIKLTVPPQKSSSTSNTPQIFIFAVLGVIVATLSNYVFDLIKFRLRSQS